MRSKGWARCRLKLMLIPPFAPSARTNAALCLAHYAQKRRANGAVRKGWGTHDMVRDRNEEPKSVGHPAPALW